jgi:hypothetical protein
MCFLCSNTESAFQCGLCSITYCSEQCAITDWTQKHQFDCIGVKRNREMPLRLIGIDGLEVEVDMGIVDKIDTISLMLEDDPDAESLKLPVRMEVLRLIALFAIDGRYPQFRNLEQLSEFLNAANYLGVQGIEYAEIMGNFQAEIITSLIESSNVIWMDLIKQYFLDGLSVDTIGLMLANKDISDHLRTILRNHLIQVSVELFPQIFAKWGTQGLTDEQKDAIIEALFVYYDKTNDGWINATTTKRDYYVPPRLLKTLISKKIPGTGPGTYYKLSDILDVVLMTYGSLENMRRKRLERDQKKAIKVSKKAQEEKEKYEKEYQERVAKSKKLYEEAKNELVAKYGPGVLETLEKTVPFYPTYYATTNQWIEYFNGKLFSYIRQSFLKQFKDTVFMIRLINAFLTQQKINLIWTNFQNFNLLLSEFSKLVTKANKLLEKFRNIFRGNGLGFGNRIFFEKHMMQMIDLSEDDFVATIFFEYDAFFTELIRARDYSKLQQFMTPEKFVEIYEQVKGKEDDYIFVNLKLTKTVI